MASILPSKGSAEPTPGVYFTYRLELNYIGTTFFGWQSQPHGNTVQDALERALTTVLRRKVRVLGASRTDTGVHAEYQVATFRIDQEVDAPRLFRALQALVAPQIGILSLALINGQFNPIKSACAKLYRYRIWLGPGSNAFIRPYSWAIPYSLDFAAMEAATALFVGRHNFRSFAAVDGSSKTFERTINAMHWVAKGDGLIELYVLGEGFLKQMVRNIVGTLVEVGQGRRKPESMLAIIEADDRRAAGMTAPAQGLSLVAIYYDPKDQIEPHFLSSQPEFAFSIPPRGLLS